MSRLNSQKRGSRTNSDVQGDDDDALQVQEYKRCVEEIHRCLPDLPMSAVQKMALERMQEERGGRREKKPPDFLRGMMSKLRIGNKSQKGNGPDAEPLGDDEHDQTFGSLSQSADYIPGSKRAQQRSLAVRQSVASISSGDRNAIRAMAQSTSSDSDDDRSLEDSLENIERSSNSQRRRSSRHGRSDSKRTSRRISDLSLQLSDVEEDKPAEGEGPKHNNSSSWKGKSSSSKSGKGKGARASPRKGATQFEQSMTDALPDEIKLVLDKYNPDRKIVRRTNSQGSIASSDQSKTSRSKRSSFGESFVSIDSANFQGDFSAWSAKSEAPL